MKKSKIKGIIASGLVLSSLFGGVVSAKTLTGVDLIYKKAYDATMVAVETGTQKDINIARASLRELKAALPNTNAVPTWSSILDGVQQPILSQIVHGIMDLKEAVKAGKNITQADVNKLRTLCVGDVNDDSDDIPSVYYKLGWSQEIDILQQTIINEAFNLVKEAENLRTKDSVLCAKEVLEDLKTAVMSGVVTWANSMEERLDKIEIKDPVYDTPSNSDEEVSKPETPSEDEPSEDEPSVDKPSEDDGVVDKPSVDEPSKDEPSEDEPSVDNPSQDDSSEDDELKNPITGDVLEINGMPTVGLVAPGQEIKLPRALEVNEIAALVPDANSSYKFIFDYDGVDPTGNNIVFYHAKGGETTLNVPKKGCSYTLYIFDKTTGELKLKEVNYVRVDNGIQIKQEGNRIEFLSTSNYDGIFGAYLVDPSLQIFPEDYPDFRTVWNYEVAIAVNRSMTVEDIAKAFYDKLISKHGDSFLSTEDLKLEGNKITFSSNLKFSYHCVEDTNKTWK